jgi:hypothetical protein
MLRQLPSLVRPAALLQVCLGAAFVCLFTSLDVQAQLYKCTDAKGKVTYQEGLCSGNRGEGRLQIQDQDTVPGRVGGTTSGSKAGEKAEGEAALKAKVLEVLKDPESARFKNVQVAADGQVLCGEVNAKNAFGGYVGFKPFVADAEGVVISPARDKYTAATGRGGDFITFQLWEKKAQRYGCT